MVSLIALINQIQFFVNCVSLLLVIVIRNVNVSKVFHYVSILVIPINISVLLIFIYFYVTELKKTEDEVDILLLNKKKEKTPAIYSNILINEGKYVSFFLWGARIQKEPERRRSNVFDN